MERCYAASRLYKHHPLLTTTEPGSPRCKCAQWCPEQPEAKTSGSSAVRRETLRLREGHGFACSHTVNPCQDSLPTFLPVPFANRELTRGPQDTHARTHRDQHLLPVGKGTLIKFTGSSTTISVASFLQHCEVGRARISISLPLCK